MAEQFQTSFIPKKVTETEPKKTFSGSGLILFLGILLLVISVILAGGILAYDSYLKGAVVRKREQLQQQREAFAPELIRNMSRLSTKLTVANDLLKNHIAVSQVFQLLQDITLKTVQFNSFLFSNTDKGIQVTMRGLGLSFSSVALQADEFAKNANLSNSVFSGFGLDQQGNVTFSVTTLVHPKLISYSEHVSDGGSASVDITQPTMPEPESTPVPDTTVNDTAPNQPVQ